MWNDGIRRAEKVARLVRSFGYDIGEYGFLASSDVYSKESPNERGIPDLEVCKNNKRICLLEVTGTSRNMRDDIWIRPDKFDYARNHPETDCYLAHVEEINNIIRFLKLEHAERFTLITPKIRGVQEKYISVPINDLSILNEGDFEKKLKLKCE